MTDLAGMVTSAFGGRIAIERELGFGGMSRVFLAHEPRIGRHVVVKVLPPELGAGLSAERFRREIEVAARLQHPHVVPLLDVGAEGDVVAFTMPFIEGESLRARLASDGALPLRDAVRLWREIIDAVGYAHAHGVVHRDIKPENILLSGRHAMVTDFGVAKALGEATAGGAEGITRTGVSLGTPAYMSPEQVAGDSALDHRTDLYAAALVMWEMVVGRHPFTGLSQHELLGAQVMRVIAPLHEVAPGVPESLSTLVARCLAKSMNERPANADELLAALETVQLSDPTIPITTASRTTTGPTPKHSSMHRRFIAAFAATVVVVTGATLAMRAKSAGYAASLGASPRPEDVVADSTARVARAIYRTVSVLVAPGAAVDSTLRRQAREFVASALRRDSTLTVPTSEQMIEFMRNARLPDRLLGDPDTLAAVAREVSHAVVQVEIGRFGGSFTVSASLFRVDRGNVVASFDLDAADSTALPRALRSIGDSVLRAVSRVSRDLESVGSGRFASPASVRLMVESGAHNSARDFGRAIELARAATRADSMNVLAWSGLALTLDNALLNRAERLDAVQRAYKLRHRTTEDGELLVAASYWHLLGYPDSAAANYTRVVAHGPRGSVSPHNNLAMQRIAQRDYPLAEVHGRTAVAGLDPGVRLSVSHSNLMVALVAQAKLAAADSLLRAMEAVDSASGVTHRARWIRAEAVRDMEKVQRLSRQLLRTGSSAFSREALFRLALSLSAQGRFAEADTTLVQLEKFSERQGDPGTALNIAALRSSLASVRGDSAIARRTIEDAERRYSASTLRFMDRYYDTRIVARARLGQVQGASALLAEWESGIPPQYRHLERFAFERSRGEIAIAAGRPAEALEHFRRFRMSRCIPCDDLFLARAFDAMREPDSAMAHFARYLDSPATDRQGTDAQWLGAALKRLGELHEEQREWRSAVARYEEFVALWAKADPSVQHVVRDVKDRITTLRRRIG